MAYNYQSTLFAPQTAGNGERLQLSLQEIFTCRHWVLASRLASVICNNNEAGGGGDDGNDNSSF